MALSDLMKKGFLTSATATPATVATLEPKYKPTVATVAVANDRNYKHSAPTVATVATVAVANSQNSKSEIPAFPMTDLMLDFMRVDGMTLAEAQALAAVSVRPRPASEWMALIAALDAAIGRYCTATGLTDESRAAILAIRYRQSLASIPSALAWFRLELAHMANRPAASGQREQTKADLNLERGRLYQNNKENHRLLKNRERKERP